MINTADIKPKIMRLWGNPAQTELSPQGLRDAIEKTWHVITMEMSIISPSFLAKFSEPFSLNQSGEAWLGSIALDDIAVPVALEARGSVQNENSWSEVDTGSFDSWDYYKTTGQSVALVTGGLNAMEVRTNFNPLGASFRLRYISDGQSFSANSVLPEAMELPAFFSPMFEAGAAWQCKNLIVTERELFKAEIPSKAEEFRNEFLMLLGRYKDWLRSNRSSKGLSRRTPSNVARRGGYRLRNLGFPR